MFIKQDILFFRTIRSKHWIKNVFVFVPSFFDHSILSAYKYWLVWQTFFAFCLAASITYLFNDWIDQEADRVNPNNKDRPIAAGLISTNKIFYFASVLIILLISILWNSNFYLPILIYIGLNLAYSSAFKKIAFLDVVVVSIGFILREWAGAMAGMINLSFWLVVMTIPLSLFLTLDKRRKELMLENIHHIKIRQSLSFYSLKKISIALKVLAILSFVIYCMFCFSDEVRSGFGTNSIYINAILVLIGYWRYYFVTTRISPYDPPIDILWQDHWLHLIILFWIISFSVLNY